MPVVPFGWKTYKINLSRNYLLLETDRNHVVKGLVELMLKSFWESVKWSQEKMSNLLEKFSEETCRPN